MFSSASSTFSLKRPARCIAALASNEEIGHEHDGNISNSPSSQFVVGTCCLREANELLIIGFHEESNELLCHQVRRGGRIRVYIQAPFPYSTTGVTAQRSVPRKQEKCHPCFFCLKVE